MLRQRILAAVIVRNGIAVQSFGYERWLPLGSIECIVENLDQWGADGIIVLDTDRGEKGPNLEMLGRLNALDLSTPLTYGGGIRNYKDAQIAVQTGAERIIIDRILSKENNKNIEEIAESIGSQALIGSIPIYKDKSGEIYHWRYWERKKQRLSEWLENNIWMDYISEILAVDVNNEGGKLGYNTEILNDISNREKPILAFGGISNTEQARKVLSIDSVAAAVIGNSLNYTEQSIKALKTGLTDIPLRPHPDQSINNAKK